MAKEQSCVVCGLGSHREKWTKGGVSKAGVVYVACDNHSDAEVKTAIAAREPAPPVQEPKANVNNPKPV